MSRREPAPRAAAWLLTRTWLLVFSLNPTPLTFPESLRTCPCPAPLMLAVVSVPELARTGGGVCNAELLHLVSKIKAALLKLSKFQQPGIWILNTLEPFCGFSQNGILDESSPSAKAHHIPLVCGIFRGAQRNVGVSCCVPHDCFF